MKINIHAGHNPDGMVACGAIGLIKESTANREVCAEVIRQLQILGHITYDCTVNDGTSVSNVLTKIVTKCNTNTVDLDVSIHFNAFDGSAKGTEVLVYSTTSASNSYASGIVTEIASLGFTNRGVKTRTDLYVLKNTNAPALLVECCFVDSVEDISQYDYKVMASAIVKGITGEVVEDIMETNNKNLVETETNIDNSTIQTLYRVQVGAYSNKSNAQGMVENLQEAGYDAFITQA
ncbi:MAG: N-acetylmuramoyl-L-alanine amidase [Eubacteriales bacterium]